jgi:uncharacterized protein (DUF169 family)
MPDQVDMNKELAREFREILQHEGYLVAAKMVNESEMEKLKEIKHPRPGNTMCQLITQSYYFGRSVIVRPDEQMCYAPPHIFGTGNLPEEAWKRYVGWQVKTEEAGRKAIEAAPKLTKGEYQAIYLSPLERCALVPDVVVIFGNASQMLCIVAAYIADRGGILEGQFNGMFSCGGLIVTPMKEKRPNLVLPGNPLRLLALPDKELGCGIPVNMLKELIENMKYLKKRGGSQYPPAWPVVQWPVQPPIGDVLKPDGFPSWLKR